MTAVDRLQPSTTSLVFQCFVQTERLRSFAQVVLDLWVAQALPPMQSAIIGPLNLEGPLGPGDIVPHLAERLVDLTADNRSVELLADQHVNAGIALHGERSDEPYCSFNLRLVTIAEKDVAAARAFQLLCVGFCQAVMEKFPVYSADLRPATEGLTCFPEPPLVEGASHIVVTSVEEISDHYDTPADFLAADWEFAAEYNGRIMLSRALHAIDGPEYLEAIIEHQWAMARAAKAGETGYDDPEVLPEEDAIFRSGAARLEYVGYSAGEKLIEYSCAIGEGQHIQGWELFALRTIVETGLTPDGKAPVETVRIVFLEEWMARSEKRPLLDVGCKVLFCAVDGELDEVAA